ncbi:hypothetical protein [Mesorhizobium sp. CN2-181]|uniref:hypothetical protein n=1 Tax=Mesorhizobium yinganensis TaxID=3157707 RepID=UPI0032B74D85
MDAIRSCPINLGSAGEIYERKGVLIEEAGGDELRGRKNASPRPAGSENTGGVTFKRDPRQRKRKFVPRFFDKPLNEQNFPNMTETPAAAGAARNGRSRDRPCLDRHDELRL